MSLTYGFIDESGLLKNTSVIDENNLEIVETIKSLNGYANAYPMDLAKVPVLLDEVFWNGLSWVPPKLFPSWVWNQELEQWVSPTAPPDSGNWLWNEETLSWIEMPPSVD
jgi:hypothetical protein